MIDKYERIFIIVIPYFSKSILKLQTDLKIRFNQLQMKNHFAILLLLLVLQPTFQSSFLKTALHTYTRYTDWKERYGISYETISEDTYRFGVWLINMGKIEHHNRHSGASYTMGQNQFTGMTSEEFRDYVSQINLHRENRRPEENQVKSVGADIDWTTKGAVNPVRSAGQCGSSYAYSAAGSIQGQYFIKKGSLQVLSWQQLIDCTTSYGNHGCSGGYMVNCFRYAQSVGLVTEGSYPYRAMQGKCMVSSGPLKIAGFTEAAPSACQTVESLLAQGPVSVAVNAVRMQYYHSGIYNDCNYTENPTAGALLVGQSSTSWKVQMNFGLNWGISGYVYLAPGNTCNVCDAASQAYL